MLHVWRSWPPYARRVSVRLACLPVLLFVVYSGLFLLVDVVYDPLDGLLAAPPGSERYEEYRHYFGRDDSVPVRYVRFWREIVTFDFGVSYLNDRPVNYHSRERATASGELFVLASLAAGLTAFALGAPKIPRRRLANSAAAAFTAIFASIAFYQVHFFAIFLPFEWWDYAPPIGRYSSFVESPWKNLQQFVPPAVTLGVIVGSWSSRIVRARLDALDEARPTAMAMAALSAVIDSAPLVLGGLLVTERVYTIPGLGQFMFQALFSQDVPTIKATFVLMIATALALWTLAPSDTFRAERSVAAAHLSMRENVSFLVGATGLALFVVAAVLGSKVAPYQSWEFAGMRNEAPSFDHLLGTDFLGHDNFSRFVNAARQSLKMALAALMIGTIPAIAAKTLLQRWSNRAAGLVDDLCSSLLSIPLTPTLLLGISLFYPRWRMFAIVLGAYGFLLSFRAMKSISTRDAGLLAAIRHRSWRISALAAASITAAMAISTATIVSFLDFGLAGEPSFGQDMAKAFDSHPINYWAAILPMVIVTAIVGSFLLMRVSLDDEVPPRVYER